ncbi:MAG TPA: phage tail protein [Allosphingosinicella sp.]|jgi:phage tail-like protein
MIASEPLPNAFARLDSLNGWRAMGDSAGLVFAPDGVRLGAQVRPIPDSEASGSFGGRTLPRGVAIAADGRLFLADPQGQCVRSLVPAWGEAERPPDASPTWPFRPLWERPAADFEAAAADPFALVRPTDVKLACNNDLVIADPGAKRLVVLVMPSGAVRRVIPLEGAPTALAFDGGGRAYVVLAQAGKVVRFGRDWGMDTQYRGGAGTLDAPSAIAVIGGPVCLCRAGDPCDCAAVAPGLPNGTAFVLDGARVKALDPNGRPSEAALPERLDPPPMTVAPDESLSFHRSPLEALRLPGLAVDRRGRIGGLPLVARPRRIVLPKTGSWIAGPFDGARDRFPWDRLVLDSEAPDRTRIVVDSYADDARLDPARVADMPDESWSVPLAIEQGDLPEVLIQSPPGRYLWVRLRFVGDGEATPLVRAVELSGPRASSLRFLPPPFHQDPESASFLDRLLAFFDSMLQEPAEKGRQIARSLSPDSVEAGAFLDWLGSWFDWSFLAQWPDSVRREMIREAIPFFKARGTVPGLKRLIRWHSGAPDPWPTIIEHFRLRGRPAAPPLFVGGLPLSPAPAELAHNFTIVMPRAFVADPALLERLIEAQKPAHTVASLRLVEPSFRIGRQSSIGVDTLIGSAPALPLGLGHLAQGLGTAGGGPPVLGAAYLSHPGG